MTDLYYGGAEIPGWRKLLAQAGARHASLSYMGLRRRTTFTRPWMIDDKFPENMQVLLDSGCHTVNKNPDKYADDELMTIAEHYYDWAYANAYRLEAVIEFDALQLGPQWISGRRAFHAPSFNGKFTPVWHPEHGLAELELLAAAYPRVAIGQTALDGRDLAPLLAVLVRETGVKLHGMAMTKPDVLRDVPFATISSTSWLSPGQYGDTIIWTGGKLKRYPAKYKARARASHIREIQDAGLDPDKIQADDSTEVVRLALWSWEQFMTAHNTMGVTASPEPAPRDNTETTTEPVATPTPETRNPIRRREDKIHLPFLAHRTENEVYTDENGVRQTREIPVLGTSGRTLVNCRSCYIRTVCDAYEPDAECKYEIPISLRTSTERRAADDTVEEILLERALRGVLIEQANGGYVDGNVSAEFDRYIRFKKGRAEANADRISVHVEASRNAEMGMIGRIFGEQASERARQLEAPQPTEDVLRAAGVIDAEVVGEEYNPGA